MNITTVMVTFNRLELLKKAIKSYETQTLLPKTMIIVDNASSDGTKEYLAEWLSEKTSIEKKVIQLSENIGGSGGFYTGLLAAQKTDAEWIWIADDDAFLSPNAFAKILEFSFKYPQLYSEAAAICSSVLVDERNKNSIIIGHRRRLSNKCGIPQMHMVEKNEYQNDYFEIDLFTYVGTMIRMNALHTQGLPQKDFFIYYDDLEHSYRIRKYGKMYCIPDSKVYHNAGGHEAPYGSTWRSYYMSRNSMFFLKWHFPIAYRMMILKRYIQRLILKPLGRYTIKNQLDFDAMKDSVHNKIGISEKYYIGWKSEIIK